PSLVFNLLDSIIDTGIPFFGYVALFLFYIVQYTVIHFCNTALVGAAMIRLRGGDPTVRDGFKIAAANLLPILGWSVVSATVGLILNMISDRSEKGGKSIGAIISSLLGAAWNVVTFLVVPVLAVEGLGPIKAIQRSWDLLKQSWGEQIAGTISIGAVFGLIGVLGSLLLVGIGVGLSILLDTFIPGILMGLLLVLFLVGLGLINTTLSGIFSAAVYAYAVDGRTSLFDSQLIESAVTRRQ
ncbi:MAG: hypothetical protein HPY85_11005, partial [Anaerolineae bacterium]|nr:hypothetical protein [Anaerolineae bacterium]